MANPLLLLVSAPTWARRAREALRSKEIPVPGEAPSTDAIFLALRRMRAPLIVLITIFAVSVGGLTLIWGQDGDGNPVRMSAFEAFYFMSYTATTIGFGELPHPFTSAQRLWVTGSIYCSVIGWAYAVAMLFGLIQDQQFRAALAVQRFRRRVRRLREPFYLVAGYGLAGRAVCRALDDLGLRFVVVEELQARVEKLATEDFRADTPALAADASGAEVLGLAGLGSPQCEAVLAMTDDDEANLAIVMAAQLLRPDMPVVARCDHRITETRMRDFEPDAVVNPYDRYGTYLVMALQRPTTYQLVSWLVSPVGTTLPPRRAGLDAGRWVVSSDDAFGQEVAGDLTAAGLDVTLVDPTTTPDPDVTGAVGFVAGTSKDTTNLSLATRARIASPSIFVSLRQQRPTHEALLAGIDLDSVFVPTDLVARETVARVVALRFWTFVEHAAEQDEAWCQDVIDTIVGLCGDRLPSRWRLRVDAGQSPALVRWLADHELTLEDLLRDPDDRDSRLAVVPLLVVHGERAVAMPDLSERVEVGDELILTGRPAAYDALRSTVYFDTAMTYVATGVQVGNSWLWRTLSARAHRG